MTTPFFLVLAAVLGLVRPDRALALDEPVRGGRPASGFTLFGGVGAGMGGVSGAEYREAAQGSVRQIGATLSYAGSLWVADFGLHSTRSYFAGVTAGGQSIDLKTRAAMMDLSVRARLGSRWQLGPALGAQFGTDTSLSPTLGADSTTWIGAFRGVYEIPVQWPVRLWQQIGTDLSLTGRRSWTALAGIQVGFGLARPLRTEWQSLRLSSAAPDRRAVTVTLDPARVFFSTRSAEVIPGVAERLRETARWLTADPAFAPERVRVTGHADRRGTAEFNRRLSTERAAAVARALREGGMPEGGLSVDGRGFDEPLDPASGPRAWARNRRVEIVFENVADADSLRERLGDLVRPKEHSR